jgi:hypothetical protein
MNVTDGIEQISWVYEWHGAKAAVKDVAPSVQLPIHRIRMLGGDAANQAREEGRSDFNHHARLTRRPTVGMNRSAASPRKTGNARSENLPVGVVHEYRSTSVAGQNHVVEVGR